MASPGGLPELDDLEQLEQEETRSISSARSQRWLRKLTFTLHLHCGALTVVSQDDKCLRLYVVTVSIFGTVSFLHYRFSTSLVGNPLLSCWTRTNWR